MQPQSALIQLDKEIPSKIRPARPLLPLMSVSTELNLMLALLSVFCIYNYPQEHSLDLIDQRVVWEIG